MLNGRLDPCGYIDVRVGVSLLETLLFCSTLIIICYRVLRQN